MSSRTRVVAALLVVAAGCKSGRKAADPPPAGGDAGAVPVATPAPDAAPPCVEIKPWAALSGGAPMLFAMNGTRVRIVDRALVELEDDTPHGGRTPGADLNAQIAQLSGGDAAPPVDAAPPPLTLEGANRICLATSPTDPARLRPLE